MQQLENNTAPERGWDDDFYPILRQSMRLWIALQMVIIVPLAVLIVAGYEVSWFHFVPPAFGLVLGLLVIFPWIQQRLGKAFSGVLIAALTFTPQIASYAIVTLDAELPARIISFISASRGLPLMFAGVIIAVWCYGFRAVIVLIICTLLIDLLAHYGFHNPLNSDLFHLLQVIGVRSGSFMVIGFFIHALLLHVRHQKQKLLSHSEQQRRYNQALEELTIHKERERMARELHDTLAHSLTGLTVQLEACKAYFAHDPIQAQKMIQTSIDIARQGATETRAALKALRSNQLSQLGLLAAIKQSCEHCLVGTDYQLLLPTHINKLNEQWQDCLYRTVQEAVLNIQKHSGASIVTIELNEDASQLSISDNGIGFDILHTPEGHFGLIGLQERAKSLGAWLSIQSSPRQGCHIELRQKPPSQ